MSSTNRGAERSKYDYYVTPKDEVRKFFYKFMENNAGNIPQNPIYLDPCAGGDIDHGMPYPEIIDEYSRDKRKGYYIITSDIRKDSRANIRGVDYLKTDITDIMPYYPDIIIANPPFNYAMEFIKKAMEDVWKGGYVIMLQRLNFLASKSRNEWFKNNMPYEIYVHSKRMSFTDDGKTDSIEYAHFVWRKGFNGGASRVYLLPYE